MHFHPYTARWHAHTVRSSLVAHPAVKDGARLYLSCHPLSPASVLQGVQQCVRSQMRAAGRIEDKWTGREFEGLGRVTHLPSVAEDGDRPPKARAREADASRGIRETPIDLQPAHRMSWTGWLRRTCGACKNLRHGT